MAALVVAVLVAGRAEAAAAYPGPPGVQARPARDRPKRAAVAMRRYRASPAHASLLVRAQAPAASAAIAYPHSRPKVSPGDSACASGLTAVIEFAIGWGRKFCAAS